MVGVMKGCSEQSVLCLALRITTERASRYTATTALGEVETAQCGVHADVAHSIWHHHQHKRLRVDVHIHLEGTLGVMTTLALAHRSPRASPLLHLLQQCSGASGANHLIPRAQFPSAAF